MEIANCFPGYYGIFESHVIKDVFKERSLTPLIHSVWWRAIFGMDGCTGRCTGELN